MRHLTRGLLFDLAVFVTGTASALSAAWPWPSDYPGLPLVVVVTPLCAVLLALFPIEMRSRAGALILGFEATTLVFMAAVLPASVTMSLWLFATTLTNLVAHRPRWSDRLFNIGVTAAAGQVLVSCVATAHGHGLVTEFATIVAGCSAYFVIDLFVTAVSVAVSEQRRLREAIPLRRSLLPFVCFVGIDSLGYLAALLYRAYSGWAMVLLIAPLATIIVAARAVARARDSERRTAGLFAMTQAATTLERSLDVVALSVEHLKDLLPNRHLAVQGGPPGDHQIGSPLHVSGEPTRWLVASRAAAAKPFRDEERQTLQAFASVAAETLDRQRLVAQMTRMARYDALSGLANRAMFIDRLGQALGRVRRTRRALAVLYCDLDGFKRVNDRFGHEAGDQVLVEVASRLRATCRLADTTARFGGDEFAVLAEDIDEPADAVALGRRVVAALETPFVVAGRAVQIGVSVGVAGSTGDVDADGLMRNADMAMYRAKGSGKNRVEFFDPDMRRQSEHRMRIEDELRIAMDEESLAIAVQPVVDLENGRVDGFEALLRWSHPSLGAVPPDVLLPVAEQMGAMPRLGRWVLHEAHRQGVALGAAAGRQVTMAVNVAAEQLRDEKFLQEAEHLAADPRVHLVLELTERALVEEATAAPALRRLADAGAGLAIDDFGIGYSSISYLHRFDCIEIVKIDRSFVLTLRDDRRTLALVESIIAMAKAFDAVVVAEGIEDGATCAALVAAGCRLGQGYLFSPAVPLPAAREALLGGFAATVGDVPAVRPLRRRA